MKMVGEEFLDRVTYYKRAWLPARELVEKAVNNRKQVWSSGYLVHVCGQSDVLPEGMAASKGTGRKGR